MRIIEQEERSDVIKTLKYQKSVQSFYLYILKSSG